MILTTPYADKAQNMLCTTLLENLNFIRIFLLHSFAYISSFSNIVFVPMVCIMILEKRELWNVQLLPNHLSLDLTALEGREVNTEKIK